MKQHDKSPSHHGEPDRPNRESNMEKVEGSRGGELTEEAVGQSEQGGGISNRPLGEERNRQDHVPDRGKRREGRRED